jgi:hypothetical protein
MRTLFCLLIVLVSSAGPGLIGLWPARPALAQVEIRHQLLDPYEVTYYTQARSIIDWSRTEIIHAIPELKGLTPAASQTALPLILQNVGNNVALFFRDFPNTTSTEKVSQQAFNGHGGVFASQFRTFRYLIVAAPGGGNERLQEYRTDNKGRPIEEQSFEGPFVLTKGFATDAVFFDKAAQSGSAFRYLGQQISHHRIDDVVGFAQNPAVPWNAEQAQIGQETAAVLVQGVAWIDSDSHQIVRLRTELLAPPPGLDLEKQTTEIEYGAVRFKSVAASLWLPRQVKVTVEVNGRQYQNISSYTNYHLFRVNTKLNFHPQQR